MISNEQELITIHHGIVDSIMRIVANLALLDQINKTGRKVFIHNNIVVEINADLIVMGLRVNLKEFLIEEHGEQEGLARCYTILKEMYIESGNNPIALTKTGHDLIDTLFISVVEDYQADSQAHAKTLH
ncbi:hypothetical protein RHO13_04770 [Orbus wheelerorum]|uniref:hypothetical protein n=1 Tax=Orbus wheelerorum TaxID=3074111 RepID=UPI00370D8C50